MKRKEEIKKTVNNKYQERNGKERCDSEKGNEKEKLYCEKDEKTKKSRGKSRGKGKNKQKGERKGK